MVCLAAPHGHRARQNGEVVAHPRAGTRCVTQNREERSHYQFIAAEAERIVKQAVDLEHVGEPIVKETFLLQASACTCVRMLGCHSVAELPESVVMSITIALQSSYCIP